MADVNSARSILDRTRVFDQLSVETRADLERALHRVTLYSRDTLFQHQATANCCYIVERGTLKVTIEDHAGEETWLAILGAGDLVGELGLIDRQPRSATVSAMTDCCLWRLPRRDFDQMSNRDFELYQTVVCLVCERLRLTNQQVCDQRLGLEGRLAQIMLRLSDAFGEPLPDGRILIRYKIGQSRLAEVAGASRENVNRQIRAWRRTGLCTRISNYYCLDEIEMWRVLAGDQIPAITG